MDEVTRTVVSNSQLVGVDLAEDLQTLFEKAYPYWADVMGLENGLLVHEISFLGSGLMED